MTDAGVHRGAVAVAALFTSTESVGSFHNGDEPTETTVPKAEEVVLMRGSRDTLTTRACRVVRSAFESGDVCLEDIAGGPVVPMTERAQLREALPDLERARPRDQQRRLEPTSMHAGMVALTRHAEPPLAFTELFQAFPPALDLDDAWMLTETPGEDERRHARGRRLS